MSLTTIQEALMGEIRGITGMRKAPDYPPETMAAFPFAVAYPSDGRQRLNTKGRQLAGGQTDFILEIHLSQKDLPRRVEEALPYFEKVLTALRADMTLGGICQVSNEIDWTFGGLPSYGGVETIGFSFTLVIFHEQ